MIAFSNFQYEDIVQYFEESLFDLDTNEIDPNYEQSKIQTLQKIILDLMSLEKISFNFFKNCDIYNSALQLKNSSNYFPSLQYLSIDFSNYSEIKSSVFENLGIFISNLESLEYLSLIIDNFNKQKIDYSFNIFSSIFKNIPKKLSSLNLDVKLIDIDSSSIEIFTQYLEKLTNLQNLYFQVGDNCQLKTENSIILANSIQKLIQLKRLNLIIQSDNQISQQGIIQLLQSIRHLKSLENLHLDIFGNETISDQILKEAKFSFQYLEKLTQFKWILKSKIQNQKLADDLGELLPCTKQLKQLDLIYEKQYILFMNEQLNGLDNLESLSIQIKNINVSIETDKLLQKVFSIQSLKQLHLKFEKPAQIQFQLTLNLDCFLQLTNLQILNLEKPVINEINQLTFSQIQQLNYIEARNTQSLFINRKFIRLNQVSFCSKIKNYL
ncbi:hypothetical protein TTHERM_00540430 (macronuclear) [Tetrahymena thermophila SB210]|uniref:Kinase domain protein n=1 Tax=Tetrahymena thermophila (strain SB210) TaxID=312017 RepID=I7MHN3_TETTS|nr:hypothetical protein TTHERM_00540430 [Tetrahymena thermophila SB210]EAR87723.2 hypothetical protein TTHERM_00540430 [Tetrahymena thermophila SB210]|eukprot:XP_001007968.2 hypothetical protein TTHERM_00540430 [Tetrahymena thermophila SB210]